MSQKLTRLSHHGLWNAYLIKSIFAHFFKLLLVITMIPLKRTKENFSTFFMVLL